MARKFPNTTKRKFFRYEIYCDKRGEKEQILFPYIDELMAELIKNYKQYNFDNIMESRWYAIEDVRRDNSSYEITLINCKYNYRPNLINVEDRTERTSPKTETEGDKEKTHVMLRGNTFIFESRKSGTGVSTFSQFLDSAWSEIRKRVDPHVGGLAIKQVLDTNFLDMIKTANRVKNIKIVAHSSLIGSEYFNFSNDFGVDDCYTLEIKAKRKKKFDKEKLVKRFESLFAQDVKVKKVVVALDDGEGNSRVVNTEKFAQQFVVDAEKDTNGVIDSEKLFASLKEII